MKVCKARIDSIMLEGVKFILSSAMMSVAVALILAAVGAEIQLGAIEFMASIGVAWAVVYLMIKMSGYPHQQKQHIGMTWRVTESQIINENKRFLHDAAMSLSGLVIYLLTLVIIHQFIFLVKLALAYAIAIYSYFSLI